MSSLIERAIERVARARAPKEPPKPVGAHDAQRAELERPGCTICGSTRAKLVVSATETWIEERAGEQKFAVVRCEVCATRYTTPRFAQAHRQLAFAGAYPFYERARQARAGASIDADAARRPFLGRADRTCAAHPVPGRILDVGCGDGFFLDVLRQRGWDAVGVDVSEDVVWHATSNLSLDARMVEVETEPLPSGPFQAVTLWGSLQLMYAPRRLLERIHDALVPDGIVAIGVSNIAGLGARTFGAHWRGLGLPRHLTHFSPETLSRALQWAGFEVIDAHYETPKWIMSGSVAAVRAPLPFRPVLKAASYGAGRVASGSSWSDTMEFYARRVER